MPVNGGTGSNWMIRPTCPSRTSGMRAGPAFPTIRLNSAGWTLGKAKAESVAQRRAVRTKVLNCMMLRVLLAGKGEVGSEVELMRRMSGLGSSFYTLVNGNWTCC